MRVFFCDVFENVTNLFSSIDETNEQKLFYENFECDRQKRILDPLQMLLEPCRSRLMILFSYPVCHVKLVNVYVKVHVNDLNDHGLNRGRGLACRHRQYSYRCRYRRRYRCRRRTCSRRRRPRSRRRGPSLSLQVASQVRVKVR